MAPADRAAVAASDRVGRKISIKPKSIAPWNWSIFISHDEDQTDYHVVVAEDSASKVHGLCLLGAGAADQGNL